MSGQYPDFQELFYMLLLSEIALPNALGLKAGLSARLSASIIFQGGTLAGGTIRPGLSAEPILPRVVRLCIKSAEWPRDRRGPASA